MTQISLDPHNNLGKAKLYTWGAKIFIALILTFGFFAYGVYVGVYKAFPYELVYELKQLVKPSPLNNERNGESRRISQFEFVNSKADVVLIGDSITEGAIWSEFFPKYSLLNRGIGSDKASDILQRLDSIISVEPKYGFIMVGINDIYQNVRVDEIFQNYVEIVRKLQDRDIDVVIQSTIQCELSRCGEKRVSKVNELNTLLSAFASKNDIQYLNLGKLSEDRGLDSSLTTDGVHLNMKGYKTWVDFLSPKLNQSLGY
ncbi:GDSL-type esterase/lipase family protein [Burkholderiales bacterium]|nr:GDSL-type esterase/lipase family protein [Burkholderiales bacterium]